MFRPVEVPWREFCRDVSHSFLILSRVIEGEGPAAMALKLLGVTLEDVRAKVEELRPPLGYGSNGFPPPFTPEAKKVLELSLREALQVGHNYIGTEHVLLGIVREGNGLGAQVLASLGADPSRVRQEVVRLLTDHRGKGVRSPLARQRVRPWCWQSTPRHLGPSRK